MKYRIIAILCNAFYLILPPLAVSSASSMQSAPPPFQLFELNRSLNKVRYDNGPAVRLTAAEFDFFCVLLMANGGPVDFVSSISLSGLRRQLQIIAPHLLLRRKSQKVQLIDTRLFPLGSNEIGQVRKLPPLVIDAPSKRITIDGKLIQLTPKELVVIDSLAKDERVTVEQFAHKLWDIEEDLGGGKWQIRGSYLNLRSASNVTSLISNVRRLLENFGYSIVLDDKGYFITPIGLKTDEINCESLFLNIKN